MRSTISKITFVMESALTPGKALSARSLAWLSLGTVWILWGSTYLGIRFAVQTIPPFLMAGVRYTIAGLLLCTALLIWKRSLLADITPSQWKSLAITAFALLVCGNGLVCFAEQHLASGVAALIAATVPIWMLAIDSVLERRRPSTMAVIGLVFGTLGIAALVGLHFGSTPIGPALLVLLAAFCWAAGSVYTRRYANGHNNPLVTGLEMVMGGVMLTLLAALTGETSHVHVSAISRESLLGFLWLVGPGAIVGYTAYGVAVRSLPTHVTSTYAYVNPVVAVILGTLIAGEPVTANVIVGGVAVIASVVAILVSRE
jgi:drug/metabolite transporter (DMT)-like permease